MGIMAEEIRPDGGVRGRYHVGRSCYGIEYFIRSPNATAMKVEIE